MSDFDAPGDRHDWNAAAIPSPAPTVGFGAGTVVFGSRTFGLWEFAPSMARDIARQLLIAADGAEGNPPSHIYQVDAR